MSADWWVKAHKPGCDESADCRCPGDGDLNVTYNLSEMLRQPGLFKNGHRDLMHAPCSEAAGVADSALRRLQSDPEHFRQWNPENGWGDYEGAVRFVTSLRDLCASWSHVPGARLEGWL